MKKSVKTAVKTAVMLLLFLGIALTTNAQSAKGKSLIGTWYLPSGSSIKFNSDGTGLLKMVDLNRICSDTNIPLEWSATSNAVTLKYGEYTYCSGHREYERSVAATSADSVTYEVLGSRLTLNGQVWITK